LGEQDSADADADNDGVGNEQDRHNDVGIHQAALRAGARRCTDATAVACFG
jgi:hypothetical protein